MNFLGGLLRLHSYSVPLEDFFTEVFAGLFRYHPELCLQWLEALGAVADASQTKLTSIETQVVLPPLEDGGRGSRIDLKFRLQSEAGYSHVVFVESKVASREHSEQLSRYAEYLAEAEDAEQKTLVYVTRHYEPKEEPTVLGTTQGVRFVQARWRSLYHTLKDYRQQLFDLGRESDLVEEVSSFMVEHGMSQQSRLSAADVAVMGAIPRVLSFMRETLTGEVQSKIREASGQKVAGRYQTLWRVEDQSRYFYYALMPHGFWCGAGFYLETETADEYPWLSVILEVGPNHPRRPEIIEAMESFAKEDAECDTYGLDDPSTWSGLEWWLDVGKLLGEEDHMAAARAFFIDRLERVKRFRAKQPGLPWGDDL